MSNPEKPPRVTVNFGDVVEAEDGGPMGVVVDVNGNSFTMAEIVERGERTYLTTFGTVYGRMQRVESAKRWTPLEVATGVTDGLWEKDENGEIPPNRRADYELAVNSLLRSLSERSMQSPWEYPQY
ncbi:MAG TPA: hypothetical protein VFH06_04840 [Candidatus Saccharimonadales bacterium]|nr:hypothetical protein [Candidatus Saccharimonadales bacterium]